MHALSKLINALDLEDFIHTFKSFLLCPKTLHLVVIDRSLPIFYKNWISRINTPKLKRLTKRPYSSPKIWCLSFEDIFEFVKLVRYFAYLKRLIKERYATSSRLARLIPSTTYYLTLWDLWVMVELKRGIYPDIDGIKETLLLAHNSISPESF